MRRLLIRPGAIGDVILTLPVLEYLKADYTEVWVPSAVVPLVQFADKVVPLSSTGIDLIGVGDLNPPPGFQTRVQGFDEVISWYGTGRPEFREQFERLNPHCEFHAALPPDSNTLHATDFFAQQTGAPLGLTPHIRCGPIASRETIAIHPFSGSARKNWPLASYLALAARLPLTTEWSAGPEETLPQATRFENLLDLAHWLSGARLYIGNDSGITHLAAAVGLPVIALFGPTDPKIWSPRGDLVTVLRQDPMEELPVEAVLQVASSGRWDGARR